MRAAALLPVLLLVLGPGLHGQAGDAVLPEYVPQDAEQHWTVGLSRFRGVGLSAENLYLTHSLPLLLRETLSDVSVHFFGPEERRGYQAWILRQEQGRLGESLQSLRRERDALFFRDMTESARSELLEGYDEKIAAAVERINALRELDPELIEFPERKAIRFKEGPQSASGPGAGAGEASPPGASTAGGLIEAPVLSPLRVAREEEVNLLIWGAIEQVQGYLYLEIRALDAHLGREVFYHSDAAEPEQLYDGLEEAAAGLSKLLLGRDWASLAVDTSPPGGEVYVSGAYAGRAPVRLDYLVPGAVEVRVQARGYRTEVLRLDLAPFAEVRELVVLEERPPDPLQVTSAPTGASVYDGSSWLGTTPLSVQRPEEPSRVVLRLEGYPEQVVYLGPDSEREIAVSFALSDPTPAELQARRRDAFYTAFGIFALSVPLPLFFWGATNDAYAAFLVASNPATYNPAEARRLSGQVEAYYNTYLATLGVSGALLVNMVIHLIRYVGAADRRG